MAERVQGVYGAVREQLWVGVGRRFQPVPRAQLVRGAGDGRVALLPAAPGTPVHAVEAGTVADVDGEGGIALLGDDGWRQHYAGLDAEGITVPVGATVRAGSILGSVSERGRVEVRLSDASGRPVDAVEVLIGLPDPGELGVVAVGEGLGVDPDALDRDLAAEHPSGWPT